MNLQDIDAQPVNIGGPGISPKHLGLLVVALAMAGCISFPPPYPKALPSLTPAATDPEMCPPVAGRYANTGTSYKEDGTNLGPVSLTGLMGLTGSLYSDSTRPPSAETDDMVVVREPANDVFEAESFKGGISVAFLKQQRLPNDVASQLGKLGYFCRNGFLGIVGRSSGSTGLAFTAEWSGESLGLRKAVDGSLIALHMKYSGGVTILIPYGSKEIVWHRFPPLPKPNEITPKPVLQEMRENAAPP